MARLRRLKRRSEFQRAARGKRVQDPAFTLQACRRPETEAELGPRVGFTVTKKVGNSVVRNRIRRRLREAMMRASPDCAIGDHDYVVMAREASLKKNFAALVASLDRAFAEIRRGKPRGARDSAETRDRRP